MPVMTLKHSLRFGLLSAAALVAVAAQANAAGFYIQEQSVRGLGSAFSGSVSNLTDPSTIYFNPAGVTKLDGMQAQAGVNLLIPDSKVKDTGTTPPPPLVTVGGSSDNPYDPTPVPNGFLSYQVTNNLWAGIGVTAPFGLASEYDDGWFGRFDSTKTELQVIDIQPTLAYKINDMFSVGVGLNIEKSNADLRNQVNLGVAEGSQKLTGDDWGFGYTVGVQFKPMDTTTIGLNYKSSVHHDLDGGVLVTSPLGTVLDERAKAKLVTPDIATLGISHQLNDRLTIQGQASWFGWNNFDNITVRFDNPALPSSSVEQNYQTTWAFAVGAEYVASDKWMLRGGVQFDATPTTDEYRTSRTPDGDRTWVSLGATYAITPKIDLDMAATYIHIKDEEISLQRGSFGGSPNGTMNADTEGNVGILALGVTYKF